MSAALNESLNRLTVVAARLNAETDDLNEVIREYERQLAEANVGVTAWVGPLIDEEIVQRDHHPHGETIREGWELGYTKIDREWRIAVRRASLASGFFQGDEECEYQEPAAPWGDPIPLQSAPRQVRLQAAGMFEKLLNELTRAAEQGIKAVQGAKALLAK